MGVNEGTWYMKDGGKWGYVPGIWLIVVRVNEGTWYLKVMWKELGSTMIQVQELGRAVVVPGEREPSTVYKYCLHSGSEAGC